MKIEDCKVGMLVIAHQKSYGCSIKAFTKIYPLGAAYISSINISGGCINIEARPSRPGCFFLFSPEDLVEVK